MINNLQNTNFKSRIVVSSKAYNAKPLEELYKCGKSVEGPWTLKEAKFLSDEGYTDGISTCVAGILKEKNGNNFYIFHFYPHDNVNPWPKLKRGLRAAIKKLKNGNPKAQLEGIMIGGKNHFIESKRQADNLVRLLKKSRINMTELLLQPGYGISDFHYSLHKDEMTFHFNFLTRSHKDLGEHFEKIDIKDSDTFEFRDD